MKIKKIEIKQKEKNKKALSPVIATVLLIAIVVVIALIIFFWLRGLTEETITKFGKKNIKLVCEDVSFEASYSSGSGALLISNTGVVPIYSMKMQLFGAGSHTASNLKDYNGWPALGLSQGGATEIDISSQISGKDKIILVPVLVGKSKQGAEKTHTCDERHGYEILIS